jgi:hypothetical protein
VPWRPGRSRPNSSASRSDGLGDQLLAHAGIPLDHERRVARADRLDEVVERRHRRIGADQAAVAAPPGGVGPGLGEDFGGADVALRAEHAGEGAGGQAGGFGDPMRPPIIKRDSSRRKQRRSPAASADRSIA